MLVDLYSQADFIPTEVRYPPERVLAWLKQFGEVKPWPVPAGDGVQTWYAFRPPSGLETRFRFDEDGTLVVHLFEHATRQFWREHES